MGHAGFGMRQCLPMQPATHLHTARDAHNLTPVVEVTLEHHQCTVCQVGVQAWGQRLHPAKGRRGDPEDVVRVPPPACTALHHASEQVWHTWELEGHIGRWLSCDAQPHQPPATYAMRPTPASARKDLRGRATVQFKTTGKEHHQCSRAHLLAGGPATARPAGALRPMPLGP